MWHVTLPGIIGVTILLLILRLGNILSVGFEQMLLQRTAVGPEGAEVLDTYVYFQGILGGQWGVTAAAGMVTRRFVGAGIGHRSDALEYGVKSGFPLLCQRFGLTGP